MKNIGVPAKKVKNIILCGMPRCGKTTVGKLLSSKLGWMFVDTDQLIREDYFQGFGRYCTCKEIFQQEGSEDFRKRERQQLQTLKGLSKAVIALGGGTICDPENASLIKNFGEIIYLRVCLEVLWERIRSKEIPAFLEQADPKKDLFLLEKQRSPFYEAYANFIVETERKTPNEIADTIIYEFCHGK